MVLLMVLVSIIIPTYNEEKDIAECLKSLKIQSLRNFETIIVDDGSTDRTIEIAKKFRVKIVKGEHRGPGYSRNLGARTARGSILVFVDADMTFDKDYLKNLIAPLIKDKRLIGSTHDYEIAGNLKNIWSRCWGNVRVDGRGKKVPSWGIPFRAIRKDKFLELGGFDPKYGYADDLTFWFKYKMIPVYGQNATCYHKNPETLKEIYRQSRWIGASLENALLKTSLKYLAPFLMAIASPIAVPILAIKRCIKLKSISLFLPMNVFIAVRYFGTIAGIYRRIYLNRNIK